MFIQSRWRKILIWGMAITAVLVGYIGFIFLTTELPEPDEMGGFNIAESTKLYDREGKVMFYEIYKEEKRTLIPAEDIPNVVREATISIEDSSFYYHGAFDVRGIVRALFTNMITGRVSQGGSTITQQLARNIFLSPEKTITRKLREIILATKLENSFSKDAILDMYLNQVPYGPNIYGVESASQAYFGKSTKELSINEAATLAALPQAPSYYSPWGSHRDGLKDRKNSVLKKMYELGYLDSQEYDQVDKGLPEIMPRSNTGIQAPHFAMIVQEYLEEKYGEEALRTGGLKITTTLNWEMQNVAETAVEEGVRRNKELYAGYNGALLALDPKTGQILAMVGSRDYFAESEPEGCEEGVSCAFEGNFNVTTQALRQPGSALKPFAYLTAFQSGLTPDTVVWDVPTEFSTVCPPNCYNPKNFDLIFRGPVTLKQGLSQSINVPSVKTLYLAGLSNTIKTAESFGITTLNDPERLGLSLVLGGGEVRMIELLTAYATLANDGVKNKPVSILKIEDARGKVLEEYKESGERVVDPQYPRIINQILSDVGLRSGLFTASLPLTQVPGYQVALKTGTTNDYVDAWSIGYTPNLVAGVWAGNNNRSALGARGSSLLAAIPMWHSFMSKAQPLLPAESFPAPEPILSDNPIFSGQLIKDEFHSILYYLGRAEDPQYQNWEAGIRTWLSVNGESAIRIPFVSKDPSGDDGPVSSDKLKINFISPQNGDEVDAEFLLIADIFSPEKLKRVKVYLNGVLAVSKSGDLDESLRLEENIQIEGSSLQNKLAIEAVDDEGNSEKEEIIIYR
ncbi:MAG: PBP1A family penicillin-binding protein [Candidatus Colwellbacteria bacterium]|nr:PBP1A family penicillin-binding protein [Candidatus Colwellbacteria bacterium]